MTPSAPPRVSRQTRSLSATYDSLRLAASEAERAKLPQMAAALSYRTIFGLLPMMIVGLVGLKLFTTAEDIETLVRMVLDKTGISAIVVEDTGDASGGEGYLKSWLDSAGLEAVGPPAPREEDRSADVAAGAAESGTPPAIDPPVLVSPLVAAGVDPAAVRAARMDDWIKSLLGRVNEISFATLGIIGLVALLYAAIGMLVEIERAFNQIYRAPTGRSWSRRVVLYWTLLTLGPLGLFATFFVGARVQVWTQQLALSFPGYSGELSGIAVVVGGYAFTVLISGTVLLLLYVAVPNARVAFRPALVGAMIAALAWEAGKWGFAQYIDYTRGQSYVRLYGSVALIPVFLLWVYLTWIVVLFGLHTSFRLQYRRRPDPATVLTDTRGAITDPGAVIGVLTVLAHRFQSGGKPQTARDVAEAAWMPEPVVGLMLSCLADAGFVHRVVSPRPKPAAAALGWDSDAPPANAEPAENAAEAAGEPEADPGDERFGDWRGSKYALAMPPESIMLGRVLEAAFALSPVGREPSSARGDNPVSIIALRRVQVESLGQTTLASMLDARAGDANTHAAKLSPTDRAKQSSSSAVILAEAVDAVAQTQVPSNGADPVLSSSPTRGVARVDRENPGANKPSGIA